MIRTLATVMYSAPGVSFIDTELSSSQWAKIPSSVINVQINPIQTILKEIKIFCIHQIDQGGWTLRLMLILIYSDLWSSISSHAYFLCGTLLSVFGTLLSLSQLSGLQRFIAILIPFKYPSVPVLTFMSEILTIKSPAKK